MNEGEIAFNFLYILLLFGLIYPPQEFFAAGLSSAVINLLIWSSVSRFYYWEPLLIVSRRWEYSFRAIPHQSIMLDIVGSLADSNCLLHHLLPLFWYRFRWFDTQILLDLSLSTCCDSSCWSRGLASLLQAKQLAKSSHLSDTSEIFKLWSELESSSAGNQQWVSTKR